jgi:hypothetical protein
VRGQARLPVARVDSVARSGDMSSGHTWVLCPGAATPITTILSVLVPSMYASPRRGFGASARDARGWA